MDSLLLHVVAWIALVAAVGSAVGVVLAYVGWWVVTRIAKSVAAWLGHDETRNP